MQRKQRAKQRGNGSILHQHRRGRGGRVDEGRGVESRERAPRGLVRGGDGRCSRSSREYRFQTKRASISERFLQNIENTVTQILHLLRTLGARHARFS